MPIITLDDIASMELLLEAHREAMRVRGRIRQKQWYLKNRHLLCTGRKPSELGEWKQFRIEDKLHFVLPVAVHSWVLAMGGARFARDLVTIATGGRDALYLSLLPEWPKNCRDILCRAYNLTRECANG